jgi:MATE family multidrug resistance protein
MHPGAAVIGLALIVLQKPIGWLALQLLGGTSEVESLTSSYYFIRIWGAPASLATLAILGTFVGLGESGRLLQTQLVLNGLNIGLDVLFASVLHWGVEGIALGTVIAEWTTLAVALLLVRGTLEDRRNDSLPLFPWSHIMDRRRLVSTLSANADIMVRTLLLLCGFAWFTNQGARFGDAMLASNHVLLQLIAACAYFLDGYAHATESLVGRAIGAKQRTAFDAAVRTSTELAAITAVLLTGLILLAGRFAIGTLTDLEEVRQLASRWLPYAATYVLFSFAAFQLDGIFIGATRTRDMRNASALSLAVFLVASWPLIGRAGAQGLWIAFIVYVIARAIALAVRLPALRASLGS